jgi:hypothetical protein
MDERLPARESYGGEQPDLVLGPDDYSTGPWASWLVRTNMDSDGNPLTTWAKPSNHAYTWQQYWKAHTPLMVPTIGGYYQWQQNLFAVAIGDVGDWGQRYGTKTDMEFRLELLDKDEVVIKCARCTFDLLSDYVGDDVYDPDTGTWTTGTHIVDYSQKFHGSPYSWDSLCWEQDYGLSPAPGPVSEWCGFRCYWSPAVASSDPWQPNMSAMLWFWPVADWSVT